MDESKIDKMHASQKAKKETKAIEKDFTLSDNSRIDTKDFRVDLSGGSYKH